MPLRPLRFHNPGLGVCGGVVDDMYFVPLKQVRCDGTFFVECDKVDKTHTHIHTAQSPAYGWEGCVSLSEPSSLVWVCRFLLCFSSFPTKRWHNDQALAWLIKR